MRGSRGFGVWGPIVAIMVVGLSFDPLKRMIQARVDRVFDQKSFDYRETLIDFGRSLNSQTDLRALVDAIVERLPQTLLVTRVAVFLAAEAMRRWICNRECCSADRGAALRAGGFAWADEPGRRRTCARWMCASWTSTARTRTTTSFSRIRSRCCGCRMRSRAARACWI